MDWNHSQFLCVLALKLLHCWFSSTLVSLSHSNTHIFSTERCQILQSWLLTGICLFQLCLLFLFSTHTHTHKSSLCEAATALHSREAVGWTRRVWVLPDGALCSTTERRSSFRVSSRYTLFPPSQPSTCLSLSCPLQKPLFELSCVARCSDFFDFGWIHNHSSAALSQWLLVSSLTEVRLVFSVGSDE